MKLPLFLCISLLNIYAFSQKDDKQNLLKQVITNTSFDKEFFYCKYPNEECMLLDTLPFFETQELTTCRTLKVVRKVDAVQSKNTIVLYKAEKTGKIYTLYFLSNYSGAAIELCFKKRKKVFQFVSSKVGSF